MSYLLDPVTCERCDEPAERGTTHCTECNHMNKSIAYVLQELADEGGQARLAEAIRVAFTDHKSDAVVGRYFRTLCSALLESHEVSLWQANDEAARA